ncbi:hypothetical protein Taro_014729, partial [Colocasia esculenta]|nr:hypothetical protein [Colocasia esculenta]
LLAKAATESSVRDVHGGTRAGGLGRGRGREKMAGPGKPVLVAEYEASKGCPPDTSLLEEIVRLERRIFPKHESLARSFEQELRKKHTGLLYAEERGPGRGPGGRGEIIGYVMYSSVSSLCASITKLAAIFVGLMGLPLVGIVHSCEGVKATEVFLGSLLKENWRRQGYGEALLKAAIEKCRTRKIQRVTLHVDPLRTAAVSLYQKLGFQVDELIEGYYSPERHAYRMCLDFND